MELTPPKGRLALGNGPLLEIGGTAPEQCSAHQEITP